MIYSTKNCEFINFATLSVADDDAYLYEKIKNYIRNTIIIHLPTSLFFLFNTMFYYLLRKEISCKGNFSFNGNPSEIIGAQNGSPWIDCTQSIL